ncbi:hypothetical protein GOD90_28985 [Sinorhizobium medicae]|nr:hypothetical protein [Sinorhizobium medicae]MDX0900928.1 hypothetical protein [Sinorhizobium medicae]MDX1176539.1 hypothetical protein [Sinorhizobium medicae]
MLGEDRELLEAIVSNSDNLTYGSIISVVHGDDETITALTDDGIDELRQMLADARRSPEAWNDFLDCFVASSTTKKSSLASRRNLRGNNRPVTSEQARQLD